MPAPCTSSSSRPESDAASSQTLSGRDRFLAAGRCQPVDRTPIWMMRQAGRALPEYRALKEKYSFLELVRTPDLAAEVTLQPIRRFGFDGAVLFSDILVVPEAMGQSYQFRETGGIDMAFSLENAADVDRLQVEGVCERLKYVADALRLIHSALDGRAALLGFSGSPWTLANFMAEGGSVRGEWTKAKLLFHTQPKAFRQLMEKLTQAVIDYLRMQIDCGAEALQIFDSLGGNLPPHHFEEASGRWIREIIQALGNRVPVILFSKGTHGNWAELVGTGANVLGIDWSLSLRDVASRIPATVALQGNLDPVLLTTTPEACRIETRRVLAELAGRPGHIFNLGHGVPPNAKLECLEAVAQTVQSA